VPLDDVVLVFENPDGSASQISTVRSRLLHGPAINPFLLAIESATGKVFWPSAGHPDTFYGFRPLQVRGLFG